MKINRIFTALFLVIAFMFSTVTPVLAASPTAAITYNPTGPYKSGTLVTITATFSEPMADSPVPQISISGVNTLPPTNMTKVSPSVYTYDFTVGSGNGTATVAIPTGMNLSSEQVVSTPTSGANFTVDNTPPAITVTTFPTVNNANKTSVTLAGACENGLAIDLAVTDAGSAHSVNATPTCSSGAWTASSLDLSSLNEGTLTATAHQTDAAGNIGTGTKTANKDTIAPAVTFDLEPGSDTGISSTDNLTNASFIYIDAIFSETISGFVSGDLSNTGTATGCTYFIGSPSGNTYPVLVSNCSSGSLIITLSLNAVTDTVGNGNVLTDGLTVSIDRTVPVFSVVAPVTNAFINSITASSDVGYTLSEALASGSITMSRTGGTTDSSSPHVCTLTGTALAIGAHSNLDLSNTTNSCTVAQSLVNGAIYTFAFNGTDLAGNVAATVTSTNVTFDTTAPVFSAVAPASNATISSITTASAVSYTLNEALTSGTITMTWTSGTADSGSPHVCTLVGTALNSGAHASLDLSNTTNGCTVAQSLVNGAIYTFAFNGNDAAGNVAATVTSTNVTFDTVAPAFSAVAPVSNASINSIATVSDVSYTLSKAIASGSITMTRTGGTADSGSPRVCTLVGTALTSGAHANLDLSNTTNGCTVAQSLVNGAIYTFAFNGTDSAGNPAATVTSTNVTFDTSLPVFSAVAPAANALIKSITTSSAVSYTLSEAIGSGSITMTWTSGTTDSGSPHICTLNGTALTIGAHNHLDLSNTTNGCTVAQSLVSGAVYTFAFNGTDLAGNTAATVTSLNVTFDNTAPVFSNVTPVTNALISNITTNSAVSYTLNETIASGSITMTRTGGSTDPGSPHICTLVGTALNTGVHSKLDLSNTTNGCTVVQSLVNGAVYTFAFNAIDAVGFTAATVTNTNVSFDTTPPAFSAVSPAANSYIMSITTSSAVSYTLSKAVTSGSITMTRTGGAVDAGSPHICTLTGMALSNGAHTSLDLSDTTNACTVVQSLVSGVIYTFAFNATDAAGNSATTVTRANVTFDNAAPVFSSVEPESGAYINNITTTASDVGYTLNEAIASGTITITRTGGAADSGSPHTCTLTGTALSFGAHNPLDLSDTTNSCTVAQTLVSGSIYTFTFNATDPVGLTAATITKTNVTYDITFPTVSWTAPVGNAERYDVADQSVTLTVNASDNLGISRVVFSRWDYQNSVRVELGRATTPPYTITFNTSSLLPQYNEIDAKAYDLADNATLKYIWLFHLPVLHVVRAGPGNGKVTSSPTGIDCGSTCSYGFNYDPTANPPVLATTVTLTATPISPSTFAGWSGACSGTGTCTVTMDAARYVTANFADPRLRIFIPLLIR